MKWQYKPKPVTVEVVNVQANTPWTWGLFSAMRSDQGINVKKSMGECLKCGTVFTHNQPIHLCNWKKSGIPQKNRFLCADCVQAFGAGNAALAD